ncbi:copper chaperone PCu(A)C [Enterovibrio makurazakiensis]|uniref:Copper chaperone PCu(A)C n=1 Tax=Enterovibrio gelatinilyticus TaxID=2899819 RepID=A0ABT5QWA7_9GAMM|nr:copper chaperone PCu(A)C [Enterovibrio sp. ZSDZ42]MDD1792289.1 copper chaperone PCu(A)C [Enterovibrio sp. ZSDZ42]
MRPAPLICSLLAGVFSFSVNAAIELTDPYARATPPRAPNSAAFMVIKNTGSETVSLIRAETPAARTVELHNHVMDGGMMKMRQVDSIEVPSHDKATLEPGGFHIMLFDLSTPLKDGERLPLTLHFSNGTEVTQFIPITKAMVESKMKHGHDSH